MAMFDERPTIQTNEAQGLFRWVRAQGHSSDMSDGSKNASGPVGIPRSGWASQSIAVHGLRIDMLTLFPVDVIWLLVYMNWYTNFLGLWCFEEMAPS